MHFLYIGFGVFFGDCLVGQFFMQCSSLVQWEQKCSAVCLGAHAGGSTFLQRGGTVLCSGLGELCPHQIAAGKG